MQSEADLAAIEVDDPFSVLTLFVARGRDLQAYAAGAALQSDDRLALEYSAPRAIYVAYRLPELETVFSRTPWLEKVMGTEQWVVWRARATSSKD